MVKDQTADENLRPPAMVVVCKSATVTKSIKKLVEWNAVNPASEKPKFGRGTPITEMKG